LSPRSIRLELDGPLARLTIDRPQARNALDDQAIEQLVAAFHEIALHPALRAVLIRGAGERCFCAGYDMSAIDPEQALDRPLPDDRFARATQAVLDSPVPVVAALQGGAWGGGLDLALACDLRVGDPGLRVAMTPCRLGLIYRHQGLQRMAARIGAQATRRLFLLAEAIDADEALRLGIIDAVDHATVARAEAWARRIASNAPLAIAGVRDTLRALERDPSLGDPRLREELLARRQAAFASRDLRRGLEAARSRRPPHFEGA
jgi:enoyl-CoA hydratase/carnithine racemase